MINSGTSALRRLLNAAKAATGATFRRQATSTMRALCFCSITGLIAQATLASPSAGAHGIRPLDRATISAAQRKAATSERRLRTNQEIDACKEGIIGDGRTDNTMVLRRLLAGGNRTIHICPGNYLTGSLRIASNTELLLAPGVTLIDAGALDKYERLLNIESDDVHISGAGARILGRRDRYVGGEWRHGVYIYGARRVRIEGLASVGHAGDGFYIGGPAGRPSSDIRLLNCKGDGNLRQGLSITSAKDVLVVDCSFTKTSGTDPQYGIDVEPNNGSDVIEDIVLLRPSTKLNGGGGILIYLMALGPGWRQANVTIIDHVSSEEAPVIRTNVPRNVQAVLRYGPSRAR